MAQKLIGMRVVPKLPYSSPVTEDRTKDFLEEYSADSTLVSRTNRLVFAYGFSLLILAIAIIFSYMILTRVLTTQSTLSDVNSRVNEIKLSVTDSVGVLSDFRLELKKTRGNSRLKYLITQRAIASAAEIAHLQEQLLETRDAFSKTDAWEDLQWIVSDDDKSLNDTLSSYIIQMKLLTAASDGESKLPQIPVEAAGSRRGSLYMGLKEASDKLNESISLNAERIKSIHKTQTILILAAMFIISALVVVPLWIKLKSEHRSLNDAHNRLFKMAYKDRETGLLNLDGLERNLLNSLAAGSGDRDGFFLLLVRITNLDVIYNLLGYQHTPDLIESVSDRITKTDSFRWSRSGEAEFTSVIPAHKVTGNSEWPRSMHESLSRNLTIEGVVVTPKVSLSVSKITNQELSQAGFLWKHQSNARLASADFDPKASWLPQYHPGLKDALKEHNNLVNRIALGIQQDQFVPHYQVKVHASTGHPSSIEVLARWQQDEDTIVSPFAFIEAAESSGLIVDLTYSLFDQVMKDINNWCSAGLAVGRVAINLSADLLQHAELIDRLGIMKNNLPALCAGLEVEITENIALDDNLEQTVATLNRIKSLDIDIAIDDFGTGYASLQTLIDFPFDVLKIDRSFVLPMTETGEGTEVISAMISLANKLNKVCVVEGVETDWQWSCLVDLGADELQGFYFHKPCSSADVVRILSAGDDYRIAG